MKDFSFDRRDILIALAIILVAFAYRAAIIVDRAEASAAISAWNPLTTGGDQGVYYGSIAKFHEGTWPPPTFFFQPGMSWFLIGASALVGTDDLAVLRLLLAALAALNCGLMVAIVRLAFGDRSIAVLAGLLLAFYPVGAFYDTDFVITAQAMQLVTLGLFGILWLWRYPRNWTGAVLFGLSFGALAVTRFELIALAPVMAFWLWFKSRQRRVVFQMALATAIAVAVMLPTILRNAENHAGYLITPTGLAEIYRGNNRDADSTYGGGQASATTTFDYLYFLGQDIQLSIPRFIELELHKIGLYLSAEEPGNNLNYTISGKQISAVLQANPLDFNILTALFIFSLIVLWHNKEQTASLFSLMAGILMLTTLLIWVEARIRTPVIVVMIPVIAYGIVNVVRSIVRVLRSSGAAGGRLRTRQLLDVLRPFLIPAGATLLILIPAGFAERNLPLPVTIDSLPSNIPAINATYDGTLELVGWHIEEQYTQAGTIQPRRPYVVTLFWKLLKPTTIDYSYSFGFFVNDQRITGFDRPIGVSYPHTPTSQWDTAHIYVEHVGLEKANFDGPTAITGHLLMSVFSNNMGVAPIAPQGVAGHPGQLELAQPALIWEHGALPAELPTNIEPTNFGNTLTLKSWLFALAAHTGENVPVTLGWQTADTPIERSYSLAVYVFSSSGDFVGQADSPPHNGALLTSSMPTAYSFADVKVVTMPATPGTYSLYVGAYDNLTNERLAVFGGKDNLKKIGEIVVS